MKKTVLLLVSLLICCCLFAFDNSVSVSVSPYSAQLFTMTTDSPESLFSVYGFGGKIEYETRPFENIGFTAGAEAEVMAYKVQGRKNFSGTGLFLQKRATNSEIQTPLCCVQNCVQAVIFRIMMILL